MNRKIMLLNLRIRTLLYMFFLVSMLSSCITRFDIDKEKLPDGFHENQKAIVIIQNARRCKGSFWEKSIFNPCKEDMFDLKTRWKNKETNKLFLAKPLNITAHSISGGSQNDNETILFIVDPGTYSLVEISTSEAPLKDLVEFTVHGGEVAYVGKIIHNNKNKVIALALDIEDHFDSADEFFKAKYPLIYKKPVKRLMKFTTKVINFRKIHNASMKR